MEYQTLTPEAYYRHQAVERLDNQLAEIRQAIEQINTDDPMTLFKRYTELRGQVTALVRLRETLLTQSDPT